MGLVNKVVRILSGKTTDSIYNYQLRIINYELGKETEIGSRETID